MRDAVVHGGVGHLLVGFTHDGLGVLPDLRADQLLIAGRELEVVVDDVVLRQVVGHAQGHVVALSTGLVANGNFS